MFISVIDFGFLQVSATDKDQGEFAQIAYSIIDGSLGKFTIDNLTGWINTTSPLDREDKDEYRLSVRAIDGRMGVANDLNSLGVVVSSYIIHI